MKKKILAAAALAALSAALTVSCAPKPEGRDRAATQPQTQTEQPDGSEHDNTRKPIPDADFGIFIENLADKYKPALPGVRRHRRSIAGVYEVEYIHRPAFSESADVDYNIEMRDDNTYTMSVVSSGVRAEHSGRWYMNRGNITFFYDEKTDPQPHNVFTSDCMCAEMLPQGKLMIYDNCNIIVLSRASADQEETN